MSKCSVSYSDQPILTTATDFIWTVTDTVSKRSQKQLLKFLYEVMEIFFNPSYYLNKSYLVHHPPVSRLVGEYRTLVAKSRL